MNNSRWLGWNLRHSMYLSPGRPAELYLSRQPGQVQFRPAADATRRTDPQKSQTSAYCAVPLSRCAAKQKLPKPSPLRLRLRQGAKAWAML